MTPTLEEVPRVKRGYTIEWCGLPARVIAVKPARSSRNNHRGEPRPGRYLRVLLPDDAERDLHYFDDELVELFTPGVPGAEETE